MRAMMSESPGGPESLKLMELPSKPLGKGQVRIDVKAAGVNFPDTLIIADKYQFKPPRPFAPGHEVAGKVAKVGPGVTGFLSEHYGLSAPIYLAAVMSCTSIVATMTLLRGGEAPRATHGDRMAAFRFRTYAQYFARPELRPLLLQFLFFMLAFTTFISGFALFAERRFTWNGEPFGPREIGYVFSFVGFLGIILQGAFIGQAAPAGGREEQAELGHPGARRQAARDGDAETGPGGAGDGHRALAHVRHQLTQRLLGAGQG